ncbi:histone-lysine N-methyltransferase 2B-like [Cavia porcellus]|uniref:histone-lysine N-methyltransferase 2B-like n=1 Tax=Cavia porcellus TaxID=10141 RepID=UPI002FE25B59
MLGDEAFKEMIKSKQALTPLLLNCAGLPAWRNELGQATEPRFSLADCPLSPEGHTAPTPPEGENWAKLREPILALPVTFFRPGQHQHYCHHLEEAAALLKRYPGLSPVPPALPPPPLIFLNSRASSYTWQERGPVGEGAPSEAVPEGRGGGGKRGGRRRRTWGWGGVRGICKLPRPRVGPAPRSGAGTRPQRSGVVVKEQSWWRRPERRSSRGGQRRQARRPRRAPAQRRRTRGGCPVLGERAAALLARSPAPAAGRKVYILLRPHPPFPRRTAPLRVLFPQTPLGTPRATRAFSQHNKETPTGEGAKKCLLGNYSLE